MFKYFIALAKFIHILQLSHDGIKMELFYFCSDCSSMDDTETTNSLGAGFKPYKSVVCLCVSFNTES